MESLASDREIVGICRRSVELPREVQPILAKDSVCGVCGGTIEISRYTGVARCEDCETPHELQDVWMFQPKHKPVVVKSWCPVEDSETEDRKERARIRELFIEEFESGVRIYNQLYYFANGKSHDVLFD